MEPFPVLEIESDVDGLLKAVATQAQVEFRVFGGATEVLEKDTEDLHEMTDWTDEIEETRGEMMCEMDEDGNPMDEPYDEDDVTCEVFLHDDIGCSTSEVHRCPNYTKSNAGRGSHQDRCIHFTSLGFAYSFEDSKFFFLEAPGICLELKGIRLCISVEDECVRRDGIGATKEKCRSIIRRLKRANRLPETFPLP
eukprot:TRINITY_DN13596_c0_g1_i1.p1 TRINITY_DN13596_c0_g1~~TRINITY_DN13596_c0_g1_i1.p1  ORF type:complete len:195 (-),score=52.90 TRINITY_DN13596_c0_g1_i1:122-706(-)